MERQAKKKKWERKDGHKKMIKSEVSQQGIFNYCNWLEFLQRKRNEVL